MIPTDPSTATMRSVGATVLVVTIAAVAVPGVPGGASPSSPEPHPLPDPPRFARPFFSTPTPPSADLSY